MATGPNRRHSRALAALALVAALSGCAGPTLAWTPAAHVQPATPTPTATASKGAPTTFTLSAVGDTILASAPHYLPPNGGAGLFDDLGSALHSDLQMANLEEPITNVTTSTKCGASLGKTCFAYRAPTSYATVLHQAGFDLVNIANNHALDYGSTGHAQTEAALTAAGVDYTGPPGMIPIETVKGIRVAVLGFAPYAWANNLLDLRADQTLVARAKTMADVVIVQAHMGGEGPNYQHVKPGAQYYLGENRGDVIAFSHAMIDAGADVVIGTGPHVLRGMEFYQGRLIAYSIGNFDGYHALALTGPLSISLILRVTLRANGTFVRASMTPISLAAPGLPRLDPAKGAIPLVRSLTHDDFPSTGAQISATGAITPPTT
jgi:poly-gamma-glutamate capsule biosynthesis protein CapA/YwtB (metallophosphatase superfamily)